MQRKSKSNLVFLSVLLIIAAVYFYRYKVAPQIVLSEISFTKSGQDLNLEGYSDKNLILCFYSSSCGPCMKELPVLNGLYSDMLANDIDIIAFTNDKEPQIEVVKNRFQLNFELLTLSKSMTEYGIYSIPTVFIFNERGDLVYKNTGQLPWESSEIIQELKSLLE